MKIYLTGFLIALSLFLFAEVSHAQVQFIEGIESTDSGAVNQNSIASESAFEVDEPLFLQNDITRPEEIEDKEGVFALFNKRPVNSPNLLNFVAFAVQESVRVGVPANTIVLILLLPLLATMVAITRLIIGLSSLEMLVPVALSITLLATGVTAGLILLMTIVLASFCSRFILKKIRIMQIPKLVISLFVVSIFVFATLTLSAVAGLFMIKQLSFLPVLILILLSDKIVALSLERNLNDTIQITGVTIGLAVLGYLVLSLESLRDFVLLYPEVIFAVIVVNLLIGRYFGLRVTEYFRFAEIKKYGN